MESDMYLSHLNKYYNKEDLPKGRKEISLYECQLAHKRKKSFKLTPQLWPEEIKEGKCLDRKKSQK